MLLPVDDASAQAMAGRECIMPDKDIEFLNNEAFNDISFGESIAAWQTLKKTDGKISVEDLTRVGILPKSGYDPKEAETAASLLELAYYLHYKLSMSLTEMDALDRMSQTNLAMSKLANSVGGWIGQRMTAVDGKLPGWYGDVGEGIDDRSTLRPQSLMNELADSGVKHSSDDVVMVTKTPNGQLRWLEKGNSSSGLTHIADGHVTDFANRGINDIPSFLNQTLQETPVKTGTNPQGPFADYLVDGKMYKVVYGTNGYVVSFYPIK